MEPVEPRTWSKCAFCGDPFEPNRNGLQRYCTLDCRYRQARQVKHDKRVAEKAAERAAGLDQAMN